MIRWGRALVATGTLLALATCARGPAPALAPAPPTFEQKMAWILRLEDSRILRDPAPPPAERPAATGRRGAVREMPPHADLLALLADSEGRIRRRAALAVGRVGLPQGVEPLVARLFDPEPGVRQMVAFALGLLGDRRAAPALRAALADPSPLVRGRAAEALGLLGDGEAAPAIGAMVSRALEAGTVSELEPDAEPGSADLLAQSFRLGVCALARLKAFEPLAAAVVGPGGRPRTCWWPVAYALQQTADRRAASTLLAMASGQGSIARAMAVRGLGMLKDGSAVDLLVRLAQEWPADRQVGLAAVEALGQIGDRRAAPALLKLLQVRNLDVTLLAGVVEALGALRAREAMELLLDLIAHPAVPVRLAVLEAVRAIDPDGFLLVLSGLDPDPHWRVRAAIATMRATLDAGTAVPALLQALKDSDPRVIPAVLAALTRVAAPNVDAVLLEHLRHPDPVVRAAAAAGLGERRPANQAPALVAAYQSALADTTSVARAAALGALARYGPAVAMPALRTACSDPDWAVRVRAAQLARELDPAADFTEAIRPAPTGHDPAWYEASELIAPSVSPHVLLDTSQGTIEIELAVLDAPQTAAHMMAMARSGFLAGLTFHRVVPDFAVFTGDPRGDGEGGAGYTLRDEISDVPFGTGTVGMVRDGADSNSSQFFITRAPQPHLEGRCTAVGRVVAGMDVVMRLAQDDMLVRARVWDGKTLTGREGRTQERGR